MTTPTEVAPASIPTARRRTGCPRREKMRISLAEDRLVLRMVMWMGVGRRPVPPRLTLAFTWLSLSWSSWWFSSSAWVVDNGAGHRQANDQGRRESAQRQRARGVEPRQLGDTKRMVSDRVVDGDQERPGPSQIDDGLGDRENGRQAQRCTIGSEEPDKAGTIRHAARLRRCRTSSAAGPESRQ